MWASADFELAWPKSIFLRELDAIVPPPNRPYSRPQFHWLLEEAFVSKQPGRVFRSVSGQERDREFVFDLRHGDEKHHTDYDPVFLDWPFWWYLATVELIDRLLARQRGRAAATAM